MSPQPLPATKSSHDAIDVIVTRIADDLTPTTSSPDEAADKAAAATEHQVDGEFGDEPKRRGDPTSRHEEAGEVGEEGLAVGGDDDSRNEKGKRKKVKGDTATTDEAEEEDEEEQEQEEEEQVEEGQRKGKGEIGEEELELEEKKKKGEEPRADSTKVPQRLAGDLFVRDSVFLVIFSGNRLFFYQFYG